MGVGKNFFKVFFIFVSCAVYAQPYSVGSDTYEKEMKCLAENIYFEARNEGLIGQIAIAYVTMNRVYSKRHPSTICDVVYQGPIKESWATRITPDPTDAIFYPIKNRCQFSWYCDGNPDRIYDKSAWKFSKEVAEMVSVEYKTDRHNDPTHGAEWYHADYVSPYFHSTLEYTTTIGAHIFYKKD